MIKVKKGTSQNQMRSLLSSCTCWSMQRKVIGGGGGGALRTAFLAAGVGACSSFRRKSRLLTY